MFRLRNVIEHRFVRDRHYKFVAMLFTLISLQSSRAATPLLEATRLANLPDSQGVAAPFVGVSNGVLIVGGGTNFPDRPPWQQGTKTWYDTVYVLASPDEKWQQGFKLPRKLAYGISITTETGLICIGGCDESRNYANVFCLLWEDKELKRRSMPSLPEATSCSAGALIGSRIYVAGGQPGPDPLSGPSQHHFWSLDLERESDGWEKLPSWPGPERFYAVAGTDGRTFYLLSGLRAVKDAQGDYVLEYLKDAYQFDPTSATWARLADLPHPNGAAPTPAPFVDCRLLLLGRGVDGVNVDRPIQERENVGADLLAYNIKDNAWRSHGVLPFARVAVPAAQWNGRFVIASGEIRPGVRSPEIWFVHHPGKNGK